MAQSGISIIKIPSDGSLMTVDATGNALGSSYEKGYYELHRVQIYSDVGSAILTCGSGLNAETIIAEATMTASGACLYPAHLINGATDAFRPCILTDRLWLCGSLYTEGSGLRAELYVSELV